MDRWKMSKRKRKKRFFDFFGFDAEELPFPGESSEGGSGYSMSVSYDRTGKPVVQVKTYGELDIAGLRKDIEQKYPGAKIEGLEKKPLIRIVDEGTDEEEKGESGTEKEKR